ncbi:MAG: metalloregulator ArsR/SmtB family transcription factor [Clostridiales Family XIII bacterium]|jgi:ArsR family transcriptional regulator|nr:metalloregulator ArsR/SmtB family transcription factor [Clostridiales Family XIII bacterium]
MSRLHDDKAKVYKAFSDSSSLMILELLQGGELCANGLLAKLPIAQSTLSHHMKTLTESDIVDVRRDGKMMVYSINSKRGKAAADYLTKVTAIKAVTTKNV